MKVKFYEVVFKATETLQNGNERTVKKSVYMLPFEENGNRRVHVSPERQIEKGTAALKAEHYYNITYVETKTTSTLFAV